VAVLPGRAGSRFSVSSTPGTQNVPGGGGAYRQRAWMLPSCSRTLQETVRPLTSLGSSFEELSAQHKLLSPGASECYTAVTVLENGGPGSPDMLQ
jgi:hypothetical protein